MMPTPEEKAFYAGYETGLALSSVVQSLVAKDQDATKVKFFLKDLAAALSTTSAPPAAREFSVRFMADALDIEETLEPKTTPRQLRTIPTAATPAAVDRARKDLVEFTQLLIVARK